MCIRDRGTTVCSSFVEEEDCQAMDKIESWSTCHVSIVYNYPPRESWIVVDIYWDTKRRVIYPPLFSDPKGDSCLSIYQIRWIKKTFLQFLLLTLSRKTCHLSLCSQNSEYPRILQVMGANQNARKLLSTDLVDTNTIYCLINKP